MRHFNEIIDIDNEHILAISYFGKYYYKRGTNLLHNINGPAFISNTNSQKLYYLNGYLYNSELQWKIKRDELLLKNIIL